MFRLKGKLSIYIILIILLIAFPLIKAVYAEDSDIYNLYEVNNLDDYYELSEDRYSIHFNAAAAFDYLQVFMIGSSDNYSVTLSLYKWDNDSKTTLNSTPLFTKDYNERNNNDWLTFDLNDFGVTEQEPGEYFFTASSKTGNVAVRVYRPAVTGTRTYMNEYSIYGSLQSRIHFTEAVNKPLKDIAYNDDLVLITPPPKSSLSKDDPIVRLNVDSTQWVATDGLGRTLPGYNGGKGIRKDRYVGIFFWTWHYNFAGNEPRNVTRIIEQYPEIKYDYYNPIWDNFKAGAYFWNEPIYGYYSIDEYVLRKQAELLADAGVDFIVFDCTNGDLTWSAAYLALLEVFDEARKDGVKTPQIAFMLQFAPSEYTVSSLKKIYYSIYKDGRYQDLWFYWEGKPLVLADSTALLEDFDLEREIKNFFTFKKNVASYFEGSKNDSFWGWLHTYPQAAYYNKDGTVEQVTVGVAQNANYVTNTISAMNNEYNMGRSYTKGYYSYSYTYRGRKIKVDKNTENSKLYGLNFQQQWDYALSLDPEIVFVTGWNEWIAGRYEEWEGVYNAFPDQYDDENSRDIEPSKGDLKDHYYYQLVANIRRFKGISKPVVRTESKGIDIFGSLNQWDDISEYNHYTNSTLDRDNPGWSGTHYVNKTMRNDFVKAKVTYDSRNIYFYIETRDAISPYTDQAWMRLFIDTKEGTQKSRDWEEFEYVINRKNPNADTAYLERSTGGWNWEEAGKVRYSVNGNVLQIEVPRKMLGLKGTKVEFNFKWSDNMQEDGDIMDFYVNGDVAPGGRFMFHFTNVDYFSPLRPIFLSAISLILVVTVMINMKRYKVSR